MPVVLIHLAAFGGLYALMYETMVYEILRTREAGAEVVLHEVKGSIRASMPPHSATSLRDELLHLFDDHHLVSLRLYDVDRRVRVTAGAGIGPGETDQVARAFEMKRGCRSCWFPSSGVPFTLAGVQVLRNEGPCRKCHGPSQETLGAVRIDMDITRSMNRATRRVRRDFALFTLAWVALSFVTIRIRDLVIGRPLDKIHKTMEAAGSARGSLGDLDSLAERLQATIGGLLERAGRREQEVSRQMARAEQLAALGEVAAGLTHEIKNPLGGIDAALREMRAEEAQGSERRAVLDEALSLIGRVTGTLDGLLRLARPQPPKRENVDLVELARRTMALFEPHLKRKGIQLTLEVPAPLPSFFVDPGLIGQVLVNLITNSQHATGLGGRIDVLLAPFPNGDGVVLSVADDGRGIDRENLEHVFDPFFTTREEGTGLGLAICRQIVTQHGGTVSLESEPGKGTRVVVLLPRQQAGAAAKSEEGSPRGADPAG